QLRRTMRPIRRHGERSRMKIRPLHDRILVKRVDEETKTKGGIILPDTAKEKPQEGKVIAVGAGKVNEDGTTRPMDVKSGDRILFSKHAGTGVKVDRDALIITREDDVLGILGLEKCQHGSQRDPLLPGRAREDP